MVPPIYESDTLTLFPTAGLRQAILKKIQKISVTDSVFETYFCVCLYVALEEGRLLVSAVYLYT